MTATKDGRATTSQHDPRTLAVDVGGTGLKASVLDGAGRMLDVHPTALHQRTAIYVGSKGDVEIAREMLA